MKNEKAYFKVDTKLAELLGETYRSVEAAIKELVDNAYDADAETLKITFPKDMAENPKIIIKDNGSGMKENEVKTEYLNIANSRIKRKGNLSIQKKRKVKGRKGIGKFSGLMIANQMKLQTYSSGTQTTLIINKDELAKANYDLEKVPLSIKTEPNQEESGTKVILSGLNQNFNYPNSETMKQILMREYGRETDFEIYINGEKIGVLDLPGQSNSCTIKIDGKKAILDYTITSKPTKNSGISIKVGNKVIGKPLNLLSDDEIIPSKLQKRIYGEINCDDLEEDVTADWGAIVESSKLYDQVKKKAKEILKDGLNNVFKTDMKMAHLRFRQKINKELEKLPEYKHPFAKKALHKILEKYYDESEEKINTVITVMISAMEKDHYWGIIQNIESCRNSDVERFANALSDFGMLEMGIISSQVINRLRFIEELNILIDNPKTLEKDIHKALEKNTWILGDDYSVLFSEKTLKTIIEKTLDQKYTSDNQNDRPDLLLKRTTSKNLLLIEFKRPNYILNRDTEAQALKYTDELRRKFGNQPIEIILLGGDIKQNIETTSDIIKFKTYKDVISLAENRLNWMLEEFKKEN